MGNNAPRFGNQILFRCDAKMVIADAKSKAIGFLTRETITVYSILLAFEADVLDLDFKNHGGFFANKDKSNKVFNEVKSALNSKYGNSTTGKIGEVWTTDNLIVVLYRKSGDHLMDGKYTEKSEYICILYTTPELLRLAQMEEQPFLNKKEAEKRAADEAKKRKEQQSLDSL